MMSAELAAYNYLMSNDSFISTAPEAKHDIGTPESAAQGTNWTNLSPRGTKCYVKENIVH